MKQFLLFFFAMASCFTAMAQLKADAGRDTTWCSPNGLAFRSIIGGASPAYGGAPPYRYLWTSYGSSATARDLLEDDTLQHPRLHAVNLPPNTDSAYFVLQVTDAANAVAHDTVKVYYSHWAACLGYIPATVKESADTVDLPVSCTSPFSPIFSWNPATYLSDPTVPGPRCWTPVSQFYNLVITDNKGCYLSGIFFVEVVAPTAVSSTSLQRAEAVIAPNPTTSESVLGAGTSWLGGTISIFTAEGRLTGSLPITRSNTPLRSILPTASGIYFYQLNSPSGRVHYGKFVRQ